MIWDYITRRCRQMCGTWRYSKEYLHGSNQTQEFPTWQQQQQHQLEISKKKNCTK
jgi:hypothetical protein